MMLELNQLMRFMRLACLFRRKSPVDRIVREALLALRHHPNSKLARKMCKIRVFSINAATHLDNWSGVNSPSAV